MNYSIGIQLGDEEGEKLNVWIFVKMALQGIVEHYNRTFMMGAIFRGKKSTIIWNKFTFESKLRVISIRKETIIRFCRISIR